jgi:uncharacterized protein
MKYLLVMAVVGVVLWLMFGSRRRADKPRRPAPPAATEPMVACAHCGLNLPRTDALQDAAARPFCSEAHRAAGPH